MPQLTLSNRELFKKTLRTTAVMVGSTALWLGALSFAAVVTTGPEGSSTNEAVAEKAGGAPVPGAAAKGSAGVLTPRPGHRPLIGGAKSEAPNPGDPI